MTEKNQSDPPMNKEEGKKKKHGVILFPNTIGPYTIQETIGEGAFSIVKLVKHELLSKYFACKIVPLKMLEERKLVSRFELEIRISRLMRHPGVAAITNILKDENNFYVIMEYYPYGNLLDYIISKKKLPEDESKGLMYQIFDALQFIHSQKVAHRDLKPENIMIDQNGHLRISDFGLSRFVDENDLVKTPCGSPCYVSPECIGGKDYNGLISDIWSCGVILYAMVTGMLPWTKRKMHDLFRQIRAGEYKIPKEVSAQCSNLIQLLLTVDSKNRITLEEGKRHTWFNVKTPEEEKKYLDYLIPTSSLAPVHIGNKVDIDNQGNEVPYLSTKAVDIYFRPDDDIDFGYQFSDIKNIHAIDDSVQQDKCESSSPYLPFENTMKLLEEDNTTNLKIRKRVVINPKVEGGDDIPIPDDNNGPNLGLRAASGVKIKSISSTGQLILLKKTNNDDMPNPTLKKYKSHGRFTKEDLELAINGGQDINISGGHDINISGEQDINISGEPDINISGESDMNISDVSKNIKAKKTERIKLKPRKSAKLPKRFEPTPNE